MIDRGFIYCVPPFMIRSEVVTGVMSFAEMDAMMYKIEGEDLYLIGTSEHSMIGKFIDTMNEEAKLPYTLTSYSPFPPITSIGSTFLILTRDKAPHKIEVKIKLTEMVRLSFRVIKEGTLLGKNGAIMVAKPRPSSTPMREMMVSWDNWT